MKKLLLVGVISTLILSGCAPRLVITNRDTGVTGTGTATGATFSSLGNISLSVDGDKYNGTWVAMRDAGDAGLSFYSRGPKDSGVGIANLTSSNGKFLRCEFGYNMTSLSGIGICKNKQGNQYDLMMSM